MIGIIDCQIGNIGSLRNALTYVGAQVDVISHPDGLNACQAVVLPGVGAFDPAMAAVEASEFGVAVKAYAKEGRPVLGICLGMQLLTRGSDEGHRSVVVRGGLQLRSVVRRPVHPIMNGACFGRGGRRRGAPYPKSKRPSGRDQPGPTAGSIT